MADPIIFTITEAGKQAAFAANADSAQLKINLTQVAVGTKKRTVTGNETALTTEFKRGSIVSGDVEAQSNTLRFTSSMTANVITDIYRDWLDDRWQRIVCGRWLECCAFV